ncbi:Metallo-dependent phosphatase-like protein [Cokeromyces recurvatus]|uniref:Metallo-dependent phosphatase-like protein n=1 Tax=Cokeromyces recurvatus TaxID=90255 RepID=UPI002220C574|nr:Metallo-dependent phosphatase-like protein [Cokeromyces recurvatus]KAI7898291.1 Metallo-dependent phosphatase-like protein [Cokeromyces recurvatus]
MVLSSVFTCISACVLLIQSVAVIHAAPTKSSRSLKKTGHHLHGRFLHITDLHLDPYYREGADPSHYCHRYGKKRSKAAGKFGALGTECDSPGPLVEATFNFLKKEIKNVDFILYTGDTVRHDRDDKLPRTDAQVLEGHRSIIKYFKKTYSHKMLFVPTIGNNDTYKHNKIKKRDHIFRKLKAIWRPLELDIRNEFLNGGYFTHDLIKNKLSVINLNTMYFFDKNNDVDDCDSPNSPGAIQMRWLENQLEALEKKKGKQQAYIMGHVPPIDDNGSRIYKSACYDQYFSLLGKHGSVIAGHFTGHTNDDNLYAVVPDGDGSYEFVAANDKSVRHRENDLERANVPLFNAPSVIPVHNPAIRVYHYETQNNKRRPIGTITDWDQYYVDLDKANEHGQAEYQLEYSASKLYNVDYFDGEDLGQAILNIATNKRARKIYNKYAKVST